MQKQSFIIGAVILVIASLFNRIVSFAYRIFIIRLVGDEGIGLYEMVFPIYVMVLVLATAGIPLAVSKLVSGEVARNNLPGAYKIFRIALVFLVTSGAFFSAVLYYSLPLLTNHFLADPRVYIIFKAMIPGIFFVSVSSAFRGFFQGLQQMTPTAITQVIEQIVRVIVGIFLSVQLLPYGLEYGVMGIAIGMVAGEVVGLISILLIYLKKRPRAAKRPANIRSLQILKDIHHLSVPITLTRIVATVIMSIEAILIPQRLQAAGFTFREATSIYGQFSGIALSLLVLPTVITISLAITLVPAISEATAQKNHRLILNRTNKSLSLTILIGIPSVIIFYLLPIELTTLLFKNEEAGVILKTMALGGIFLYLQQTCAGILQGLGEVKIPLRNSIIGGTIRLSGIYFLTALPFYGIKGAAIAANLSFLTVALLNLRALGKIINFELNLKKTIIKPLIAGLFMWVSIHILKDYYMDAESMLLPLIFTIGISSLIYSLVLLLTGAISISDILRTIRRR